MAIQSNNSGTLYQLPDGSQGICWHHINAEMMEEPLLDAYLQLVDSNMQPIMSKNYPEQPKAIVKAIRDLTFVKYIK
jgi:hypothetical protein